MMRKLAYIPAVAMMILIFIFSHSEAEVSNSHSDGVAYAIVSALDSVFDFCSDEDELRLAADSITHIIRKIAHFAEYMVLCIFLLAGLKINGKNSRALYITAAVITALYACTDEIHQLFVRGRYGSMWDVLLDTAGAIFGCMIFYLVCKNYKKG